MLLLSHPKLADLDQSVSITRAESHFQCTYKIFSEQRTIKENLSTMLFMEDKEREVRINKNAYAQE